MDIFVSTQYLKHSEGTKFYEVTKFHNDATRQSVMVRRWGKIADREGGGQSKIELFDDRVGCDRAASAILKDKANRGYGRDEVDFGFNSLSGSTISMEELRLELGAHYKDIVVIDRIVDGLGVRDELSDDVIIEGHDEEVVPPVEVKRDSDWGSW